MYFSRFAAVLALASFTFALPRPHDACPGIVAHDGDGACLTLDRRQMDHGSMHGSGMPAPPAPTPMPDHSGMEGMNMKKRHGPDGDDEAEMPKAAPTPAAIPVPVAAPVESVAVPAPVPAAPMAGHGHGAMKRHDACPGIVNHDGDGAC